MNTGSVVITSMISVIALIALMMLLPQYNAWRKEVSAEADLRAAEYTKRIMIETATAERDAARLQAEAIEIVGAAAQKYPEYRQQQFILAFGEALDNGNIDTIIYVPTEANIPILEAGRNLK